MALKIGDTIYVESAFFLDHGEDDFVGGRATVSDIKNDVSGGKMTLFVQIEERPGHWLNWGQFLVHQQDELRERFGDQEAHKDPDPRPEFNAGW